jgi:hypothetical protein
MRNAAMMNTTSENTRTAITGPQWTGIMGE